MQSNEEILDYFEKNYPSMTDSLYIEKFVTLYYQVFDRYPNLVPISQAGLNTVNAYRKDLGYDLIKYNEYVLPTTRIVRLH